MPRSRPLDLRRATPADAPAVASIHLRARAAAGSAFPPPVHRDDELLPHLLRDVLPVCEVWLAVVDGSALGYLTLDGDLVADLFVDPSAQGSGVGGALLAHAKAARPSGLDLWVFTTNERALRFYAHHGFLVVGGSDGDNEEGAPDLLLRWREAP